MNATPLFGQGGSGVCWRVHFELRHVVTEVYQTNPNLSVIFLVNDAEQLKDKLLEYCASMVFTESWNND